MSQDIEIDPDSRTIKYYEKPDVETVRLYFDSGGSMIDWSQAKILFDEIDRLRKDCAHYKQAALDISDVNDRLKQDIDDQAEGAAIWDQVEAILDGFTVDPPRPGAKRVKDLLTEIDRLRKLVPPESERGPGFVGQGTWSVFAEKVVEERDAAQESVKRHLEEKIELRDELSSLCEEIRCLKEENDEMRDELEQLGDMVSAKNEHANCHYGDKFEFNGIEGYGNFSLKRVDKDRWEIQMLKEKVTLYNKKGKRVRGDHTYDGG